MEEATSENVLAGIAMGRRAAYMYGQHLARAPRGHVDTGLGKAPALGSAGIAAPTETVGRTAEELVIDGVRFVFQYTPASEAPAELTFYLPELKAFCGAEIVSHTLHNLYTLRGAKVRDALKWSGYIDEAIRLFGDAEVVLRQPPLAAVGQRAHHGLPAASSATPTAISTTRRCAWQRGPYAAGDRRASSVLPAIAARASSPTAATTAPCATTRRRSTSSISAGTTATPRILNPLPPAEPRARYVESMGGARRGAGEGAGCLRQGRLPLGRRGC